MLKGAGVGTFKDVKAQPRRYRLLQAAQFSVKCGPCCAAPLGVGGRRFWALRTPLIAAVLRWYSIEGSAHATRVSDLPITQAPGFIAAFVLFYLCLPTILVGVRLQRGDSARAVSGRAEGHHHGKCPQCSAKPPASGMPLPLCRTLTLPHSSAELRCKLRLVVCSSGATLPG